MSDSFQVRRRPILAQLVVFSPNDLFDDRLCDLIPMLCPAAVTNPDGDFGTTKDIALIGPLAETDRLIASSHAATLAKIAALHVVCTGHGPHRSSTPHLQRSTSVSRPCVNYFTQSAQIRHAVVWISFGAGPLELSPNLGDGRGQAAVVWACDLTTSIPSVNFIPRMIFGNWLWPLRRRQLFSAASASLKIMASAVLFERHPLERTVR